jgi:DNA-binding transcriptional ArsR family regulator
MNAPADEAQLDLLFLALSHVARRRMLDLLKRESGCNVNRVCELFEAEISRFMVMKHLAMLERAGLVNGVRDGRDKRLYLDPTPLQLVHERWTTEFSAFWAARLTHLKYAAEGADVQPFSSTRKKQNHG